MEEYVAVVTDEEGEQVEESRNETELLLDFGDAVSFHDKIMHKYIEIPPTILHWFPFYRAETE